MSVTLFCILQGASEASEAFPVDINRSLTVGHLKDAIKAKKPNDFAGIDANKLKLWKVEIPSDYKDLIQGQLVLDDELLAVDEIQEHWTAPKSKHIHIIIGIPLGN